MSALFTTMKLGPIELRNRIVRAAAFEGACPDGLPSQQLTDHHCAMAIGGVGMTTVAYAAVSEDGRTFSHQMWMREAIVAPLRELTGAVHKHGAAVSLQLGHAGCMADGKVTRQPVIAPSRVFNLYGLVMPRAMSEQDIAELVQAFVRSARMAREAGFDAVEIQAGHGYLISQFLSPFSNRRRDGYGGSPDKRGRLLSEVLRAVRDEVGKHLAIVVKMNLCDGFDGGLELPEAIEHARTAEREGADALVLSGGFASKTPMYIMRGDTPLKEMMAGERSVLKKVGLKLFGNWAIDSFPYTEAYFLDMAREVRAAVSLPLALVGGLRSRPTIDRVLDEGFELVAMARALIREPSFAERLRQSPTAESLCEPCNLCMATMYHGLQVCPEA